MTHVCSLASTEKYKLWHTCPRHPDRSSFTPESPHCSGNFSSPRPLTVQAGGSPLVMGADTPAFALPPFSRRWAQGKRVNRTGLLRPQQAESEIVIAVVGEVAVATRNTAERGAG